MSALPDGFVMCEVCHEAWFGAVQCNCTTTKETAYKPDSAVLQVVQGKVDMTRKTKPDSHCVIVETVKSGKRKGQPKRMSILERKFQSLWDAYGHGYPAPLAQHYMKAYDGTHNMTPDFIWLDEMVVVELDGGIYSNGGHNRPAGYKRDCKQRNWLTTNGYRVLVFPTGDVNEDAIDVVKQNLDAVIADSQEMVA